MGEEKSLPAWVVCMREDRDVDAGVEAVEVEVEMEDGVKGWPAVPVSRARRCACCSCDSASMPPPMPPPPPMPTPGRCGSGDVVGDECVGVGMQLTSDSRSASGFCGYSGAPWDDMAPTVAAGDACAVPTMLPLLLLLLLPLLLVAVGGEWERALLGRAWPRLSARSVALRARRLLPGLALDLWPCLLFPLCRSAAAGAAAGAGGVGVERAGADDEAEGERDALLSLALLLAAADVWWPPRG